MPRNIKAPPGAADRFTSAEMQLQITETARQLVEEARKRTRDVRNVAGSAIASAAERSGLAPREAMALFEDFLHGRELTRRNRYDMQRMALFMSAAAIFVELGIELGAGSEILRDLVARIRDAYGRYAPN